MVNVIKDQSTPAAEVPAPVSGSAPEVSTSTTPDTSHTKAIIATVLFAFLFIGTGYLMWMQVSKTTVVEEELPPTEQSFNSGYIKDISGGCPLTPQTFTFTNGNVLQGAFGSCSSLSYSATTSLITIGKKKLVTHQLHETVAGTTSPAVIVFGKAPVAGTGRLEYDPVTQKLVQTGEASKAPSSDTVTIEELLAATTSIPMTSSSGQKLRVSFIYRGGYTMGIFSAQETGFHFSEGSLVFQSKP